MRSFGSVLVLSLAGLVAACAGSSGEDTGASGAAESTKSDNSSVAYGPCGWSRAQILAQVSSSRQDVISRGFEWYDAKVPFSKTGARDKYRTDCSGFVSMCWQLGAPGMTTTTLGTSSGDSYKLSSYDELVPADALVWAGHHSFIFLGWNDSDHKGMCVLEEASTASDMQFRVRLTASLKGSGFVAVRSNDLKDDTDYTPAKRSSTTVTGTGGSNTSTGTGSDTSTGTGTGTDTTGNSGSDNSGNGGSNTSTSTTPSCTPFDATAACKAAYNDTKRHVECGKIPDNCGGYIDCDAIYGGCTVTMKSSTAICSANQCTDPVCHPKSAADACAAAKLKSYVECGTVDDGCGNAVNCDDIQGFGCSSSETCSENKCYAPDKVPTTSTTTGATTTATKGSVSPAAEEDNGDDSPEASNDTSTAKPARTMTSSAGCNAAPGSNLDLAPLAGLAIVIGALRRRRDKKQA